MIVQSTRISREGGVHYLARHLLDKTAENQRIEIIAGDRNALYDAYSLASVKRCRYSLRHLSISPEREMKPAQLSEFLRSIDEEFNVGAERPRLIVRHVKNNRSHFHIAIAEVDPVTQRVLDCRHDYTRLESLARRYEQSHDETVQPSRTDRRLREVQGFSDVARKRAERVAPQFDRTKLKRAYTSGIASFLGEVETQGLRITHGDKGSILIDASGTFVAAANRSAGVKRDEFEQAFKEISHAERNGNEDLNRTSADDRGEDHVEPSAAPVTSPAATGAGSRRAAIGDARAHLGRSAPASGGTEVRARKARSRVQALTCRRYHEEVFVRQLGVLDLDDLLRRARELAAWIMSAFEPDVDRLTRQISDIQRKRKLFRQAEITSVTAPSYDPSWRISK